MSKVCRGKSRSFQREHQILKAACHLSCAVQPCVECGINGKLMQRLVKGVRAEWEKRIPLLEVTGEVIHEENSLHAKDSNRNTGVLKTQCLHKQYLHPII